MLNAPLGKHMAYPPHPAPESAPLAQQPAAPAAAPEEAAKPAGSPLKQNGRDEAAGTIRQALSRQAQLALSALLDHIRQELEALLMQWEPDPGLSEEENLAALQKLLEEAAARLMAEGQPLLMDEALEESVLKALSALLKARAGGFLSLMAQSGAKPPPEQLLSGLFLRLTGTRPSPGAVSRQAAELLRRLGTSGGQAGVGALGPGPAAASETGVLYRRDGEGVRPEGAYRAQVRYAREHGARAVRPGTEARPAKGADWAAGRDIRLVERFVRAAREGLSAPTPEAAPYVSEERLGLETGLLWLKAEAAAAQPGTSPTAANIIRDAAQALTQSFLYQAGRNLNKFARRDHAGMAACPDLRLEDALRVRDVLARAYLGKKPPERAVLEAVRYAQSQFEGKQADKRFQTWLRYALERGLFTARGGQDDLRAGWKTLCVSWNQFRRDMGLGGEAAFREAAGFQSLWAMILPTSPKPSRRAAPTPAAAWGWALGGASAAAAVCGVWYAQGVGRLGLFAACLVLGGAALLLHKK